MNWTPAVWQAIDQLAQLDLAHYAKHVHNREAFLGKARAERVAQHVDLIASLLAANPNVTAEAVVAACNPSPVAQGDPEWAKRRDYERGFRGGLRAWEAPPVLPRCDSCGDTGRVADGFCGCPRGVGKQAFALMRSVGAS